MKVAARLAEVSKKDEEISSELKKTGIKCYWFCSYLETTFTEK